MKRVFISQPMNGVTEKKILKVREEAKQYIESILGEEVEIIDSNINVEGGPSIKYKSREPVWYLGESIKLMADADYVYFTLGWSGARGCIIERQVAEDYGIDIIS